MRYDKLNFFSVLNNFLPDSVRNNFTRTLWLNLTKKFFKCWKRNEPSRFYKQCVAKENMTFEGQTYFLMENIGVVISWWPLINDGSFLKLKLFIPHRFNLRICSVPHNFAKIEGQFGTSITLVCMPKTYSVIIVTGLEPAIFGWLLGFLEVRRLIR